jgi:hypothetical protein
MSSHNMALPPDGLCNPSASLSENVKNRVIKPRPA